MKQQKSKKENIDYAGTAHLSTKFKNSHLKQLLCSLLGACNCLGVPILVVPDHTFNTIWNAAKSFSDSFSQDKRIKGLKDCSHSKRIETSLDLLNLA